MGLLIYSTRMSLTIISRTRNQNVDVTAVSFPPIVHNIIECFSTFPENALVLTSGSFP